MDENDCRRGRYTRFPSRERVLPKLNCATSLTRRVDLQKINANNAWNVALIDYFHDMSLLRNDNNSINFQRASYTLDGCVKIWTSRVDSVGTDTGKLLNNLANEARAGADDEEGEDGEGEGEGEGGSQKKKKIHRPASTLAKDANQLRNKKVELEFRVDPLFRKTCADFDEGGANGLLMNHLSLGMGPKAGMRVVFDASDSVPRDDDDTAPPEEPLEEVDLSFLRSTLTGSLRVFGIISRRISFPNRGIPTGSRATRDHSDLCFAGGLFVCEGWLQFRQQYYESHRHRR